MNTWNKNRFVYCYGIFLALILSWHLPFFSDIWTWIDHNTAYGINKTLQAFPAIHNPIAFLNSHPAHWIYDACIFFMISPYILQVKGDERKKRLIFIAFLILWHLLSFYICHRVLVWKILNIQRTSPSLILENYFHLSTAINWIKVKVTSHQSFPSDHGYTVFSFTLAMLFLRGKKAALTALFISLLFGFPRLYVGAHWLTDYIMGSMLTVLFNFSWIYASPIPEKLSQLILSTCRSIYDKATNSSRKTSSL